MHYESDLLSGHMSHRCSKTTSSEDSVCAVQCSCGHRTAPGTHWLSLFLTLQTAEDGLCSNLFEVTLSSLMEVCTHQGPLPAASFCYCFPICKAAILKSYSFSSQENALALIELHSTLQVAIPRNEMLGSLIYLIQLLTDAPLMQTRAREAMIQLSSSLTFQKGEEVDQLKELLQGLLNVQPSVRSACMKSLECVPSMKSGTLAETDLVTSRLWCAKNDTDPDNAVIGERLWKMYNHPMPPNFFSSLFPLLTSKAEIQEIIALSIAAAVREHPSSLFETVTRLMKEYEEHLPKDPKFDETCSTRVGIAAALGACAAVIDHDNQLLVSLFQFFLHRGLLDSQDAVRHRMDKAGLDFITEHGKEYYPFLLPVFEDYLKKRSENEAQDKVRESVAIWMGALARHMDANPEKVLVIFDKLMEVLRTPSEPVQRAVAKCIIPLMSMLQDKGEQLCGQLLDQLQNSSTYAERRGAAYGLAGVVKGLGISSLKKYNIMTALQTAVEDKKHPYARQGALFAFECLCNTLERLFEPYVIQILPKLLVCYGDNVADVREATTEAAKAIMSQLSAHGVKLVLPALLKALEDRSWRTKVGK